MGDINKLGNKITIGCLILVKIGHFKLYLNPPSFQYIDPITIKLLNLIKIFLSLKRESFKVVFLIEINEHWLK